MKRDGLRFYGYSEDNRVYMFPEESGVPVFCSTGDQRVDIFEKLIKNGYIIDKNEDEYSPEDGYNTIVKFKIQLAKKGLVINGDRIKPGNPTNMFTPEQLTEIIDRWSIFLFDKYLKWAPDDRFYFKFDPKEEGKEIIKALNDNGFNIHNKIGDGPYSFNAFMFNHFVEEFIPYDANKLKNMGRIIIPLDELMQLINTTPSEGLIEKIKSLEKI